jgi:hypothetical protein
MVHRIFIEIVALFKFILLLLILIIPGFLHGIVSFFLLPVGALLSVFMGRQVGFQSGQLAVKVGTIVLLVILPAVFYIYVWEPLGIALFICMALYVLVRVYARSLPKDEKTETGIPEDLERLIEKYKSEEIKYNPVITVATVILNTASMLTGYLVGGVNGLWIGVAISVILWSLSPFAEKRQDTK